MIFYIDGSAQSNAKMISGAVVIPDVEEPVVFVRSEPEHRAGFHETFAFVFACQKAYEMNVSPCELSIYTDDEMLSQGNRIGDPHFKHSKEIETRIKYVCDTYFDGSLIQVSLDYLVNSRIVRVKGHHRTTPVYHRWADYRARTHCKGKNHLPYDSWLKEGVAYVSDGKEHIYYHPFTN